MSWDLFKSLIINALVTFVLQAYLFAQNAISLSETENSKGTFVEDNSSLYKLNTCVHDSVLYSVTSLPTGDKRSIYCFDLRTRSAYLVELQDNKKEKLLHSTIYGIERFKNYIVLLGSDDIFVLEVQRSGHFRLIKTLQNEYFFKTIKPIEDKLFLYIDYKFHPLDAKYRHVWAYFNPVTLAVEGVKIQPEENTWLSFFINSWVDVCNGKIAYANTTDYRIRIYDKNFQVIDSIVTDELNQNAKYVPELKDMVTYSKDGVTELWEKETKLLYRIRKVYFLNDSTISVMLKPTSESIDDIGLIVDYWQKNQRTWRKLKTEISTSWYQEGLPYSASNMTYRDFYQNVFDIPYLGGYNFCEAYYPYIPIVTTEKFDVNKDYLGKQNEAIRSKNTHFGIKIVTVSLPETP